MRKIRWVFGLVVALAMASTALAQGPVPQHSDPNWQAAYWNNMTLSGPPVLQRSEANLDHDWGTGSPDPGINADGFSARWTRYIEEAPGLYRFTATSDDGLRVWVDSDLIIDQWTDHSPITVSVDKNLGAGHHLVLVEFYENAGGAVARVSWAPASPPITAWRGEYFDNMTFGGSPAVVRDDAEVNFNWGAGSPAPGIGTDRFSVRWTRNIDLPAGTYRFSMTVDDGGRLWVNNHHLIEAWRDQPATTYTGDIYLPGGAIPIKMEYYENTGSAVAQLSWAPVSPPITAWRGEYFNNMALAGSPAVVRDDADINFNWGSGSPAPGIGADHFSVRWTRDIDLPAGTYRFSMTVDDGGRLWVNNQQLIEAWRDQPATTYTGDIYLPGGAIPIKMAYYENVGSAVARLSWAPVSPPITAWRGEYFNNMALAGSPAVVRDDADVNFNWGGGSPAPGIGADRFSVRWTRDIDLPAGTYRFSMTVDDGGRLWVNNQQLIEAWRDQPATTYTGDVYLPGGAIPIKMAYYENTGFAVARLSWIKVDTPPPPPDVLIVDDTDPGFVKGGSWSGWRAAPEGYGGHLTWTQNNDRVRSGYNWARWYPSLGAGWYEVLVYIPERYTTTSWARYWIAYGGGFDLRVVDQSANGNRWVSLGTYWFDGSGEEYVSLSDVTYEPRLSRLVGFDAMKWEPR